MKPLHSIDTARLVGWILFAAVVMAAVGIAVQLYRFGAVMEPGSIGPAGSARPATAVQAAAPTDPVGTGSR